MRILSGWGHSHLWVSVAKWQVLLDCLPPLGRILSVCLSAACCVQVDSSRRTLWDTLTAKHRCTALSSPRPTAPRRALCPPTFCRATAGLGWWMQGLWVGSSQPSTGWASQLGPHAAPWVSKTSVAQCLVAAGADEGEGSQCLGNCHVLMPCGTSGNEGLRASQPHPCPVSITEGKGQE